MLMLVNNATEPETFTGWLFHVCYILIKRNLAYATFGSSFANIV